MDNQQLVDIWRRIIVGEHKSWVVFAHGICVVVIEPAGDLAEQTTAILAEYRRSVRVARPVTSAP